MNKGIVLVFCTALISGFSIFINSFGVKGFDSSVFTFSKNIIVAVSLFAILLGIGNWKELKNLTKNQWLKLTVIGLAGGSIPFLLFFKGLQMTTGAAGSFIHKTMFVYVAVFAMIFLKEKMTKGILAGAILLMGGTYVMIQPELKFSLGNLLILAATLFWAIENTLAKYVLRDLSGTTVAFGRMFFGSVFILAFLSAAGKISILFSVSTSQWTWILISDVFLLLYVLTYYNGLKFIKVTTAAAILTLGAPITTILSWSFLGATVTINEAAGMLLIVTGIILIVRLSEHPPSTALKAKGYGWA
nr:DMT family transporter [Deltaproteobacteria bacterium]